MRIYLTGFMGAGKTTIGRHLASLLGWDFYDLDQVIERASKNSISEIFESSGENRFRTIEAEHLQNLLPENAVISTGGGCFIENREWMLNHGKIVYLNVPFEELVRRIGGDSNRPLWKNAAALFEQRRQIYGLAHFTVEATASPESVALQIKNLVLP